jgi:hypothetical protein
MELVMSRLSPLGQSSRKPPASSYNSKQSKPQASPDKSKEKKPSASPDNSKEKIPQASSDNAEIAAINKQLNDNRLALYREYFEPRVDRFIAEFDNLIKENSRYLTPEFLNKMKKTYEESSNLKKTETSLEELLRQVNFLNQQWIKAQIDRTKPENSKFVYYPIGSTLLMPCYYLDRINPKLAAILDQIQGHLDKMNAASKGNKNFFSRKEDLPKINCPSNFGP